MVGRDGWYVLVRVNGGSKSEVIPLNLKKLPAVKEAIVVPQFDATQFSAVLEVTDVYLIAAGSHNPNVGSADAFVDAKVRGEFVIPGPTPSI